MSRCLISFRLSSTPSSRPLSRRCLSVYGRGLTSIDNYYLSGWQSLDRRRCTSVNLARWSQSRLPRSWYCCLTSCLRHGSDDDLFSDVDLFSLFPFGTRQSLAHLRQRHLDWFLEISRPFMVFFVNWLIFLLIMQNIMSVPCIHIVLT